MTIREAICDRLTRLGVAEVTQHALMLTFDTWDLPGDAVKQAEIGRTIFWIAMDPRQVERHDAKIEAFGQISRSAPVIRFASSLEVMSELNQGHFGIAVSIADVLTQKGGA